MQRAVRLFVSIPLLILSTSLAVAGSLPLQQGKYVIEGVDCEEANTASSMYYGGNELNTAHIIGKILSVSKIQNKYHVLTKYQGDGGAGGNSHGKSTWNIQVLSDTRIIVSTDENAKSETFRLCR